MYFHPSIPHPVAPVRGAAAVRDPEALSQSSHSFRQLVEERMIRILIPVDGSRSAERAVEFVTGLYPRLAPAEVRLLHVRPPELLPPEPLLTRRPREDAHACEPVT